MGRTRRAAVVAAVMLAIGSPGAAQAALRDYCPARPGLGTPACTIDPGHVSVETGLADWTRDDTDDSRTDTVLIGDTLVRIGLTDTIEALVGFTPFGHDHERDRLSGAVSRADRVGDALLGAKVNLHNPDGSGFSIAAQPFVTVPLGRAPIGAGDFGAGFALPMSYGLGDRVSLQFTPELDAAVDDDGDGRHFAASGIFGMGVSLSDELSGTIEYAVLRDDDPDDRTTQSLASLSFGYTPGDDLQLDIGGVAGLNRDSPDVEAYLGVSRRF